MFVIFVLLIIVNHNIAIHRITFDILNNFSNYNILLVMYKYIKEGEKFQSR